MTHLGGSSGEEEMYVSLSMSRDSSEDNYMPRSCFETSNSSRHGPHYDCGTIQDPESMFPSELVEFPIPRPVSSFEMKDLSHALMGDHEAEFISDEALFGLPSPKALLTRLKRLNLRRTREFVLGRRRYWPFLPLLVKAEMNPLFTIVETVAWWVVIISWLQAVFFAPILPFVGGIALFIALTVLHYWYGFTRYYSFQDDWYNNMLTGRALDANFEQTRDICSAQCHGDAERRSQTGLLLFTAPFTIFNHFISYLVFSICKYICWMRQDQTPLSPGVALMWGVYFANVATALLWLNGGPSLKTFTVMTLFINQKLYNAMLFRRDFVEFLWSFIFGNILVSKKIAEDDHLPNTVVEIDGERDCVGGDAIATQKEVDKKWDVEQAVVGRPIDDSTTEVESSGSDSVFGGISSEKEEAKGATNPQAFPFPSKVEYKPRFSAQSEGTEKSVSAFALSPSKKDTKSKGARRSNDVTGDIIRSITTSINDPEYNDATEEPLDNEGSQEAVHSFTFFAKDAKPKGACSSTNVAGDVMRSLPPSVNDSGCNYAWVDNEGGQKAISAFTLLPSKSDTKPKWARSNKNIAATVMQSLARSINDIEHDDLEEESLDMVSWRGDESLDDSIKSMETSSTSLLDGIAHQESGNDTDLTAHVAKLETDPTNEVESTTGSEVSDVLPDIVSELTTEVSGFESMTSAEVSEVYGSGSAEESQVEDRDAYDSEWTDLERDQSVEKDHSQHEYEGSTVDSSSSSMPLSFTESTSINRSLISVHTSSREKSTVLTTIVSESASEDLSILEEDSAQSEVISAAESQDVYIQSGDVLSQLVSHPGTLAWKGKIQEATRKFSGSTFMDAHFHWIMSQLGQRNFFIGSVEYGWTRLNPIQVQQKCRECYEKQKQVNGEIKSILNGLQDLKRKQGNCRGELSENEEEVSVVPADINKIPEKRGKNTVATVPWAKGQPKTSGKNGGSGILTPGIQPKLKEIGSTSEIGESDALPTMDSTKQNTGRMMESAVYFDQRHSPGYQNFRKLLRQAAMDNPSKTYNDDLHEWIISRTNAKSFHIQTVTGTFREATEVEVRAFAEKCYVDAKSDINAELPGNLMRETEKVHGSVVPKSVDTIRAPSSSGSSVRAYQVQMDHCNDANTLLCPQHFATEALFMENDHKDRCNSTENRQLANKECDTQSADDETLEQSIEISEVIDSSLLPSQPSRDAWEATLVGRTGPANGGTREKREQAPGRKKVLRRLFKRNGPHEPILSEKKVVPDLEVRQARRSSPEPSISTDAALIVAEPEIPQVYDLEILASTVSEGADQYVESMLCNSDEKPAKACSIPAEESRPVVSEAREPVAVESELRAVKMESREALREKKPLASTSKRPIFKKLFTKNKARSSAGIAQVQKLDDNAKDDPEEIIKWIGEQTKAQRFKSKFFGSVWNRALRNRRKQTEKNKTKTSLEKPDILDDDFYIREVYDNNDEPALAQKGDGAPSDKLKPDSAFALDTPGLKAETEEDGDAEGYTAKQASATENDSDNDGIRTVLAKTACSFHDHLLFVLEQDYLESHPVPEVTPDDGSRVSTMSSVRSIVSAARLPPRTILEYVERKIEEELPYSRMCIGDSVYSGVHCGRADCSTISGESRVDCMDTLHHDPCGKRHDTVASTCDETTIAAMPTVPTVPTETGKPRYTADVEDIERTEWTMGRAIPAAVDTCQA